MMQSSVGSWGDNNDLLPLALGFVAACPRLAELTIVLPYQYSAEQMEMGFLLDQVGMARSAIPELVCACKALPDFDTLQIVRFPVISPRLASWCSRAECDCHGPSMQQWKRAVENKTKDLGEWAIDCLETPETGYREGRTTTLRVIKFGSDHPCQISVEVEESEV